MSGKAAYSSPLGPRETVTTTGLNFNGFVRPLGQFSPRQCSSPYNSSPSSVQDGEFIPLGYSSPIKHPNHRGRGNWKGSRRSSYSPANSAFNSSCSPYSGNRSQKFSFNKRNSRGGGGNSSTSYSDDVSLYFNRSMVEDPWAGLEKKLKTADGKNSRNAGASASLAMSDSDDPGDSQENESSASSGEGSS